MELEASPNGNNFKGSCVNHVLGLSGYSVHTPMQGVCRKNTISRMITPNQKDEYKMISEKIRQRQKENPTLYKTGPTKYQDGENKGHWTREEDAKLEIAVKKYNQRNWKRIAKCLTDRTDV